jgi:hypothetical protein
MSQGVLQVASPAELQEILSTIKPAPGEECQLCERPVPKVRKDDPTGPRRSVLSVSIPAGFPPLDPMLVDLVDKYKEQWPLEFASMRQQVGLQIVGGRSWKYHALHFATYACLMVPGLEPTEEG